MWGMLSCKEMLAHIPLVCADIQEYQKKLMSVGLLVKSRNFLVFQVKINPEKFT
jgi:hypothetical protein